MDFEEFHADVEAEGPVGGECDESGVEPERVLALVKKCYVVLDLAAQEPQGFHGQGAVVAHGELELEVLQGVPPAAGVSVPVEGHGARVFLGHDRQQGGDRVPYGGPHVGEDLQTCGVALQHLVALRELVKVVLIDVDEAAAPCAGLRLH